MRRFSILPSTVRLSHALSDRLVKMYEVDPVLSAVDVGVFRTTSLHHYNRITVFGWVQWLMPVISATQNRQRLVGSRFMASLGKK
jgi:hypothetical protein